MTDEPSVLDENVEAVRKRLADRAAVGMIKYGVPTCANPLETEAWLRHLQDELLDAAVYVQELLRRRGQ